MTVELRPMGVMCNLQCLYCYQNPQRDAGNATKRYNIDKMKTAIEAEGGPFALFGGEPLLVPLEDLDELWSWGLQKYGHNSVQTNGTLITDDHIELFKRYRVSVGISIDGPGELNNLRWHGSRERTSEATKRTEQIIGRLIDTGIIPSLIVTLHRGNATHDRLPILERWLCHLDNIGIQWARLHLLESESAAIRELYALSIRENIDALLSLNDLERKLRTMKFDLFSDMRRMLSGRDDGTTCIWNACDPYTTRAVRGVEGNGQRSNCGRTNKDGIDFVKSEEPGFERYLALYHTPQEVGGCRDCRFFLMCKGQCPGTAINGDWRNRTEHCEVWKAVYTVLEEEMVSEGSNPLSLSSIRQTIENDLVEAWISGQTVSVFQALQKYSLEPKGWREELGQIRRDWEARYGTRPEMRSV